MPLANQQLDAMLRDLRRGRKKAASGDDLNFEAKFWAAAAALRNNMDAAEYKHVFGLTFLKYVSDAGGLVNAP